MISKLQEEVGIVALKKARVLIEDIASQCKTARYTNVVILGPNKDKMDEHGSMEEYCDDCIEKAVAHKKKEYYEQRTLFMGKIYEVSRRGFATELLWKTNKEGEFTDSVKKVRVLNALKEGVSKELAVKTLEKRLRKEYPSNKIFSSERFDTTNWSEKDGFEFCNDCGILFEYSILLTSQELDYWEELTDTQLKESVQDPQNAYQLQQIFEHYYSEEHNERIFRLAARLIS